MATVCLKLVNYILFDLQIGFSSILSEPRIAPYLVQSDSVLAIESEELEDEVSEGWRQHVGSINSAPVGIQFIVKNELVKLVIFGGFSEWIYSSHHNEKYYTDGEDVDLFTVVNLSFFDLWGHIGLGASEMGELLNTILSCEPEVSKFDGEVTRQKHIFQLYVSVSNSFLLVHVVEAVDHLPQEHPAAFFSDVSAELDQVEDLVGNIFHHDVQKVCQPSVGETIFARINCSHNLVIGKDICDFHLSKDIKAIGVDSHQVAGLDDLEGVNLSCLDAFNLEDFSGKAVAQPLLDGIFLVENSVLLNHHFFIFCNYIFSGIHR